MNVDNKIKEKFYLLTPEMVRKLRKSNLTVTGVEALELPNYPELIWRSLNKN